MFASLKSVSAYNSLLSIADLAAPNNPVVMKVMEFVEPRTYNSLLSIASSFSPLMPNHFSSNLQFSFEYCLAFLQLLLLLGFHGLLLTILF